MNARGYTLIHLTDTHLRPPGELLFGSLDTWVRTAQALEAAARYRPDAVVVTGDIADSGTDIYADAARLFARAARTLACPVIVLPGNHDVPGAPAWEAKAFTGSRTATGPGPGNDVHIVGGLRVITLDSDDPGRPAGRLTEGQLDWLRSVLRRPAPDGTLLALHHPPVSSLLPQLAGRGLARPAELAGVVAGTDVRAILCGHYHHVLSGRLGGVPVWAGPAVSYAQNLFAAPETVQGLDRSWFSVIRLEVDGFSAVPVPLQTSGAPVFTKPVVHGGNLAATATLPSTHPLPVPERVPDQVHRPQPLLPVSQGESIAAPL
ncbi:3',5'-cyclic adenosine monophosphate phosphodiesterase CpdA [Arthrobacter saudimassiliensis]|uniref:3',5'-cyclic adenosine monophosphate phosphodiesterase CpdA n=1 Tax=Arthrobacter saudimassiliensis TaxID=1461584 RepID=A0A078MR71_9MICC|nr:3',5'-cyclic adenosine monophosphate phosphodiesterase CpdA [Arthrobacter saudimassiliensis]